MQNSFYITQVKGGMHQLRLVEGHIVLSAVSSEDKVMKCLYNIVKKYKTRARLFSKIYDAYEIRKIPKATLASREKDWMKVHEPLSERAVEVIRQAVKEVGEEQYAKRNRLKLKKLIPTVRTSEPVVRSVPVIEKTEVKMIRPLIKKFGLLKV